MSPAARVRPDSPELGSPSGYTSIAYTDHGAPLRLHGKGCHHSYFASCNLALLIPYSHNCGFLLMDLRTGIDVISTPVAVLNVPAEQAMHEEEPGRNRIIQNQPLISLPPPPWHLNKLLNSK